MEWVVRVVKFYGGSCHFYGMRGTENAGKDVEITKCQTHRSEDSAEAAAQGSSVIRGEFRVASISARLADRLAACGIRARVCVCACCVHVCCV